MSEGEKPTTAQDAGAKDTHEAPTMRELLARPEYKISYNDVEHTESIERYRTLLKQSDHPQIVRLKCYILLAGFLYQDAGGVQWNMEAAKKACNEMCEAYHAGTIKLTEEDVEYIMVQERIVDDAIKDTKEAWFEFRTSDVIMRCISRVQTKTRTRGVTNVEKILGTSWK